VSLIAGNTCLDQRSGQRTATAQPNRVAVVGYKDGRVIGNIGTLELKGCRCRGADGNRCRDKCGTVAVAGIRFFSGSDRGANVENDPGR